MRHIATDVLGHRRGKTAVLARLADFSANLTGLPGWAALPLAILSGSLVTAVSRGVYRTTEPIPLYGNWKSTLRLYKGTAVQRLAVYMPADEAIPVEGIPALQRRLGRAAAYARTGKD